MAGRARLQALKDLLDTETRQHFEPDESESPSHLDYVCAKIEAGTTAKALCRALSQSLGYELTYDRLARYLRDQFGEGIASSRMDDARSRASHCYAEEALEIVDAPAYDSVTVQQARARAAQRNWMAERYNPSRFGSKQGVSVSVSIGSLHLDALRQPSQRVTATLTDVVQALPGSTE